MISRPRSVIAVVAFMSACSRPGVLPEATSDAEDDAATGSLDDELIVATASSSTSTTTPLDPTWASGAGSGGIGSTTGRSSSSTVGSVSSDSGAADPTSTTSASSDTSALGSSGDGPALDAGGGLDPSCPLACTAPCDVVVDPGFDTFAELTVSDGLVATRSVVGDVVVFEATTLVPLHAEVAAEWMDLRAGVFVSSDASEMTVRSTSDWTVISTIPGWAEAGGISEDGSYVWSASPVALTVHGLDGTAIVSAAGDYTGASALALADTLHVVTTVGTPGTVRHLDLATGSVADSGYSGDFGGWATAPHRYWSNDGLTHHVYALDGTQLLVGDGAAYHVWGDFAWGTNGVVALADPTTTLVKPSSSVARSDDALVVTYRLDDATAELVDLGAQIPTSTALAAPPGIERGNWHLGSDGDRWVIAVSDGSLTNDVGVTVVVPSIAAAPLTGVGVEGSGVDRFAVARTGLDVEVWEIVDGCFASPVGTVTRESNPWTLTGDGQVVLAWEQGNPWERGTSAYAVAGGIDLGFFGTGAPSMYDFRGWSLAGEASKFSQMWEQTKAFYAFVDDPYDHGIHTWTAMTNVHAAISPDGTAVVTTTCPTWGPGSTWEDATSTVRQHGVVVGSFSGVTRGFLGEDHLLVSHYREPAGVFCPGTTGSCDVFVGSEIVDLDGVPVQPSPLPDVRSFRHVSDTEIFVEDPPRILDAYSGIEVWSTANATASPVGPDHIVSMVDGHVVVTRWR